MKSTFGTWEEQSRKVFLEKVLESMLTRCYIFSHENPGMSMRDKYESRVINGHPMTWSRYHRYNDILEFLEFMQRSHPRLVELVHIGSSYEGMPLIVVKISVLDEPVERYTTKHHRNWKKKPKKTKPKNAVFIEAGSHAQEWISPAAATWIIQHLVKIIEGNDTLLAETLKSVI